jgi:DNA-binding transcriptional LysR family regulator
MDIGEIDLNGLRIFDALMQQGSVTRAGQALGLSQPAMSAALAKLRVQLGDALFVRTGRGVRPTPRALELAGPVQRVLDVVRDEIVRTRPFDAARSTREFTIITPDIGEVVFIPPLLKHTEQNAPGVALRAVAIPFPAAGEALESGQADLAIGYFPDLAKPGFYQQRLFRNSFVCIVRAGHPHASDRFTLAQFQAAAHILVRPAGRVHLFEQFLQERGVKIDVRLHLSHFTSLPSVIGRSNLVATVPRDIGHVFARLAKIRLIDPPLQPRAFDVKQHWHGRVNADAGHRWLRETVRQLFQA